jgi:hypothetical protein
MDVVIEEKLLEHLSSRYEKVTVTSLASELERILWE